MFLDPLTVFLWFSLTIVTNLRSPVPPSSVIYGQPLKYHFTVFMILTRAKRLLGCHKASKRHSTLFHVI